MVLTKYIKGQYQNDLGYVCNEKHLIYVELFTVGICKAVLTIKTGKWPQLNQSKKLYSISYYGSSIFV